jgi:hypothetical protein
VRTELDDLSYHDLPVNDPEMLDPVYLLAAQGEELDQLLGGEIEVYILAEPA